MKKSLVELKMIDELDTAELLPDVELCRMQEIAELVYWPLLPTVMAERECGYTSNL